MTAILTAVRELPDTLDRARAGDHDAFAALVREHEDMVFSIAYHFFNDRGHAEEIAQDAFLTLYRNLRGIRSAEHLLFWLRQVTTRRCIDGLRSSRPKAVALDDVGELAVAHATHAPNDPLLDRRLRELVASLPEAQRLVVTLRYQEDLDPAEICRIAGMSVNTVKSHLQRALQSLRRKLGELP
jgi:RNA polymerase sigma-70 factor (ECF subfamily)